jgi:hypothetical protein
MHKDVSADARIGKSKADGVVDASGGKFVRVEEERGDRKAGGIGAGALIAASGWRIDSIEIPNSDKVCVKNIVAQVGLVSFVKPAMAAVGYDKMAVALLNIALVTRLAFDASAGR